MTRAIERQVNRAGRRLFLGALLEDLGWAWTAALLLAAGWFAVSDRSRGPVLGGLLAVATVAAVGRGIRRSPSRVESALAMDERFGLKERATTALTLNPDDAGTPAARALLADAEAHVAPLRVADRFPLTVPWRPAAAVPAAALVVALLAALWHPADARPDEPPEAVAPPPDARARLEEQMKKLAGAKTPEAKPGGPEVKGPDLAKIDADVERFTRQPRETKDDLRERIKDAMAIEDEIRRRQQEQAQRAEALKEQMKQADRLARKKRDQPKGPADQLAGAIARGDLDRAADELERLGQRLDRPAELERLRRQRDEAQDAEAKKRAQEQLDQLEREQDLRPKDRDDLAKQLEDLEQRLKELARDKDERKKDLDEMAERGEIDKDQLDREKDQLDRDADQVGPQEKDAIRQLAEKLGECKKCVNEGKDAEAAKKLGEACKKCDGLGKAGEAREMARRLAQMKEVRKALARGAGGAGVGAGRRPLADDKGDTDKEERWSPADWDRGKIEITGDGPRGGFKGPRRPGEMQAEIEQAAQQAPAAIDRQRLPPAARKMARGYFEQIRGAEKGGKKP